MAKEPVTVVHLQRQSNVAERSRPPTTFVGPTGQQTGADQTLSLRCPQSELTLTQSL